MKYFVITFVAVLALASFVPAYAGGEVVVHKRAHYVNPPAGTVFNDLDENMNVQVDEKWSLGLDISKQSISNHEGIFLGVGLNYKF